ncbi:hypothetical protein ACO2Q0_08925 [Phenylobacterium sp. VNQ135]|uniref:hypothetical protein n=1 Tax=Phenylobacterium sp. VNQ135 TaxID=3400922 RepID=UPI003C107F6C
MKWIVFGAASLVWIAACWFFGSMVGLTDAGPAQSIAQQECAQRLIRQGGQGDYPSLRDSEICRAEGRAVFEAKSRPAQQKGLLIGLVPVALLGGWIWSRRRTA